MVLSFVVISVDLSEPLIRYPESLFTVVNEQRFFSIVSYFHPSLIFAIKAFSHLLKWDPIEVSPKGATTLSIMKFSTTTLNILTFIIMNQRNDTQHNSRDCFAGCNWCWVSLMLSVTYAACHLCWVSLILSVSYAECHLCWLSFILSVIILNVVMLSVVTPSYGRI